MKKIFVLILTLCAFGTKGSAQPYDQNYHSYNDYYNDYGYNDNYNHGYSNYDIQARFGFFYSSLSPYGEWVDCNYGYAWRPYRVGHTWRPYLNGRWVWTSYGWYWVSYEPFGWATFHYGRWYYDDYYGWIWIPDDVWGPSWVEWRYDNDYIGWAPLPPTATFSISVGITYSSRWVAPVHYWNFVPCRNFTSVRIVDYVQPVERTRRIFSHTRQTVNIRSDNNRVVNNGIDVGFVERRGNVRINRVDVVDNNRGAGDRITRENNRERIEVFRPRLDTRAGDIQQQRDIRRQDRQRMNDNKEFDRSNRDQSDRGTFDRQQPRVPSDENNKRPDRQLRQNRGSDQQPDATRQYNPNRENRIQQQERERRSEINIQKHQRDQRPEVKQNERSQERSRSREQKDERTTGRKRRP